MEYVDVECNKNNVWHFVLSAASQREQKSQSNQLFPLKHISLGITSIDKSALFKISVPHTPRVTENGGKYVTEKYVSKKVELFGKIDEFFSL